MELKKKNDKKDLIQNRAVMSAGKYQHLVLEWSTGCGKTLAAIKILEKIFEKNPNAQGYIVCKESTHINNWKEDMIKHGYSHFVDKCNFILYASLHKCKKSDYVVYDECHALTPKKLEYARDIMHPGTRCIYLSATIPEHKKMLINSLSRYKAKYYTITLSEAIASGLLPEPKVIIHEVQLNPLGERNLSFTLRGNKKGQYVSVNYHDRWAALKQTKAGVIVVCNEKEYYDLISDQMDYYQRKSENLSLNANFRRAYHNRYLNLGSQRKKFIGKIKGLRAKEIVGHFRNEGFRFICFTGSIEQCIELGSQSAIHSKNNKDINQGLIDCFNNESCSELFAVKMLRESVNLTNIEKGIIVQLDSTIGSFYQMLGRCLRHEFPEMHLLILKDTKDEEYFSSAISDFDKKFIEYGSDYN